jgi:predicted N-acetyltransferase YhbS
MIVRLARDPDRRSATDVEREAFGEPDEAAIAATVWDEPGSFGLVAEEAGGVIGHVQFSAARIGDADVLALGPIGVLPDHQGRGVGRALIEAGLREARSRGAVAVILLGAPSYYGRLGFRPGRDFGLRNPYTGAQEDGFVVAEGDFQVFLLAEPGTPLHGDVRWHPAFGDPTA